MAYLATRELKVGDRLVQPGETVPEAADFDGPALASLINMKHLIEVPEESLTKKASQYNSGYDATKQTIDQLRYAMVSDDTVALSSLLKSEQDSDEPRQTVIDMIEARLDELDEQEQAEADEEAQDFDLSANANTVIENVGTVTDPDVLRNLIEAEKEGKDRTTVKAALAEQLDKMTVEPEEDEGDDNE